jgi:hypothetical protein
MSGMIMAGYDSQDRFTAVETCELDMVSPDHGSRLTVGTAPPCNGLWCLVRRVGRVDWVPAEDYALALSRLADMGIDLATFKVVKRWG